MTGSDKCQVWRDRLSAWDASGLSAAAFCRQHGIAISSFYHWRTRLARLDRSQHLVPVVIEPMSAPSSAALNVRLPNGVVIESADAEGVAHLLPALASL